MSEYEQVICCECRNSSSIAVKDGKCAWCFAKIKFPEDHKMKNFASCCKLCGNELARDNVSGICLNCVKPDGRKDDQQKPLWNLLPLKSISIVVDVLTHGAKKYAPDNWKMVPDAKERYFSALMRHVVAWRGGEKCCAIFLLEMDQ